MEALQSLPNWPTIIIFQPQTQQRYWIFCSWSKWVLDFIPICHNSKNDDGFVLFAKTCLGWILSWDLLLIVLIPVQIPKESLILIACGVCVPPATLKCESRLQQKQAKSSRHCLYCLWASFWPAQSCRAQLEVRQGFCIWLFRILSLLSGYLGDKPHISNVHEETIFTTFPLIRDLGWWGCYCSWMLPMRSLNTRKGDKM